VHTLPLQAERASLVSAVNRLQDELTVAQAGAADAATQLNASRELLHSRTAQVQPLLIVRAGSCACVCLAAGRHTVASRTAHVALYCPLSPAGWCC
jgi:hypothetical protein